MNSRLRKTCLLLFLFVLIPLQFSSAGILEEVEKELGVEFKKQHQGMDNLRKYFTENQDIGKYLFNKFRNTLKKA